MSDRGPYIRTFSGNLFYLLDPRPEEVDIRDIGAHLSKLCRWTGACAEFYSVAQHCCAVHDAVKWRVKSHESGEFKVAALREALMHDAVEAYTGDLSQPLRCVLGDQLRAIENRIELAIRARLGWPVMTEAQQIVREVDREMLWSEARQLMGGSVDWADFGSEEAATHWIEPGWCPQRARGEFMGRFAALSG